MENHNIVVIVKDACVFNESEEPDLFSLGINGNDFFVPNESPRAFSPKLICVEYNAKFPPLTRLSIAYGATHTWQEMTIRVQPCRESAIR